MTAVLWKCATDRLSIVPWYGEHGTRSVLNTVTTQAQGLAIVPWYEEHGMRCIYTIYSDHTCTGSRTQEMNECQSQLP